VSGEPPRVVAFGGGHGLAASLAALRQVTPHVTAVVTVADDGGSSGRLRDELDALPPGDLRMALFALAGTDAWSSTWAQLFQHRFPGSGPLGGHAVGNIVLAGLTEQLGDPVAALDLCLRLVDACGRVLPLSEAPMDIVAEVAGLEGAGLEGAGLEGAGTDCTGTDCAGAAGGGATTEVHGQVAVATARGEVRAVRLIPPEPAACPAAVHAVADADAVVLGPGSLFTSVLPHLLVPQMADAIRTTTATRILVLNLVAQAGETAGFSPQAHLEVLAREAPWLRLDVVLADPAAVPDPSRLAGAAARLGARLELAPVSVPDEPRHDPDRLADALRTVLSA